MKLNIKDNSQWIADESKKRKKRMKLIIILILIILLFGGASIFWKHYCDANGKMYPLIELQEAPTQEQPIVQTTTGYEKVVKTPTLPFTMTVKGEVVMEGASFCTLLIDGKYVTICEITPSAATKKFIKDNLIPALGATPTVTKTFNEQRGYLNNRYVETEADTVYVEGNKVLYCMSYRLLINKTTDILIVGTSADADMDNLNQILQNIFYSIYQFGDTTDATNSADMVAGITVNQTESEYPSTDVDMDSDYTTDPSTIDEDRHDNHIFDIDKNILYKEDEEKIVKVEDSMEEAVFIFSYQRDVKLKEITLYDPEGKSYQYNDYNDDFSPRYMFYVNNPMEGDWKFVYTVPNEYIGYFKGQVMSKETYDKSMLPPTPVERDNV